MDEITVTVDRYPGSVELHAAYGDARVLLGPCANVRRLSEVARQRLIEVESRMSSESELCKAVLLEACVARLTSG